MAHLLNLPTSSATAFTQTRASPRRLLPTTNTRNKNTNAPRVHVQIVPVQTKQILLIRGRDPPPREVRTWDASLVRLAFIEEARRGDDKKGEKAKETLAEEVGKEKRRGEEGARGGGGERERKRPKKGKGKGKA